MNDNGAVRSDVALRILDAAADAFARAGFANTTIDDIAHDVGATKGLIYYHFRSKLDIFLAVYEHGMRRLDAVVRPKVDGPGTGRARLDAMSVAHVEILMTDFGYHHVVQQGVRDQSSTSTTTRQREALLELNDLRHEYERLFHRVVVDGMRDGSLREADPGLATRTLLSSLNAVDAWYRPIEGQAPREITNLAHEIVALIIGGVSSRDR
ncbi:TetR/AcrR family transcriptional regulator [Rhodococcus olei]|uniref:TetR/AcrR family transcriptional regulator n=1 Tax=Rhodococcus olei TaxID=2161675 RepID=A0ABP8P5S3_9NOCA